MKPHFAAHGEFDMHISGCTLVIEFRGAFNKEGTLVMADQAKQLIELAFDDGQPWGILSDNRQLELTTPDIQAVIADIGPWFIERGLAYEAIVAPGHIQRDNIQKLHMPIDHLYTVEYFDTPEQAQCWLAEKGIW